MIIKRTMKLRWYIFKHKVGKFIGLTWCDWCDTLCFKPTILESEQKVCRHCIDEDAEICMCCENLTHYECLTQQEKDNLQ